MADSTQFAKTTSKLPLDHEVVITGVSGRFPESHNVYDFQENLFSKKNMITDDSTRWTSKHFGPLHKSGKIPDFDKIDAGFFGIHYRHADMMTPFIRKMLETAVEAVMDAGMNPSELAGTRTAVYIGANYLDMEIESIKNVTDKESEMFTVTEHLRSFIANRISYHLKLKGSSCVVDTACSGSLSALQPAFELIRTGKCDNAIVGGICLGVQPGMSLQYFRMGALSSDGISKVFDQEADGFVRAEAANCILLQKPQNARRIYAKVLYSKLNHDGFKIAGLTFPSAEVQEMLMNEILEESGIDPSDISFMEAHSTGTEVGDSEEVQAIDCAIAKKRQKPLLVGSVKSNMGHSEPASGLSSAIKVIIAMETGYIAPNINLKNIKKGMLGFEEGRMKVVTELTKLEPDDAIVGINNFGIGGSNGHLVLQRFNKLKSNKKFLENDASRLVCVSGRTERAVLNFLEDIKQKWRDDEYVSLLHHIFKTDIGEHLYRGFIIVSKTTSEISVEKIEEKKKMLYVNFGEFQKHYKILEQQLTVFLPIKDLLEETNNLLEAKSSLHHYTAQIDFQKNRDIYRCFAVQISVAKILKLLNPNLSAICSDVHGELLVALYNETMDLEEVVNNFFKLFTSEDTNPLKLSLSNNFQNLHCLDLKNCLVLNFSDISSKDSFISFGENSGTSFLRVLGRLYEKGYNFQLQNLYLPIQFPVSRGTPMISPSIHWDHSKNWRIPNEDGFDTVIQLEHTIDINNNEEHSYLTGHVIDGRNLFPAAGYLHLVWMTFLRNYNKFDVDNLPIVFENCRFIRAVTIPKNESLKLLVSIQKESGNFEVVETNSLVVSGRIFSPEDIDKHQTDLPTRELEDDRSEILEQDEIYRELHLRGYNYKGLFKGVVKCNSDVSVALIRWDRNWTAYVDKMLQLMILQMDTRHLFVPVGIKKLSMNTSKHLVFTGKEISLCPVYVYKESDIIKSGGIEISGAQIVLISKKRVTASPVLERNLFVPNTFQTSLKESIRILVQIILENSFENNFKAIEIVDDDITLNNMYIMPQVAKALNDIPTVVLDLTISSDTDLDVDSEIKVQKLDLTCVSNVLLMVATKILQQKHKLDQILSVLNSGGFLLTREVSDCCLEDTDNLKIVAQHYSDGEKLILFRKIKVEKNTQLVEVLPNQFDWILNLQNCLKRNSEVIVYSQNLEPEGILGLVNCLRREPSGDKVRCFFMMDEAPKFDIKDVFYQKQIEKQMAINVYKNKKWGTYRHLLLGDTKLANGKHFFVDNTRGDLSSLKWFEGSPTMENKKRTLDNLVYPFYCGLNFKDVLLASGRVAPDIRNTDRKSLEFPLGFEFAGKDSRGRRLMGIVNNAALTTTLVPDETLLWEIPQNWSLEDASTIPIVYGTVIYAMFKVMTLKPGMSVLIHSATGGVGLAALNICIYHDCDIYVTVGTEEKQDYIKKHFPQIPESHIGNSRDTSFEKMIQTETRGRGVDVVLNSLIEDKLRASVRCVARGGHLLEIGKYDLLNDESLRLFLLQRNISYHGIMFDRIIEEEELKRWLFHKAVEGIKLGYIKPLPRTIFDRNDIVNAFKYMISGNHLGKVTINLRDESEEMYKSNVFQGVPRYYCDPEKCYLIVGGLGGFGLELADWLYVRGASKLILVSRFGVQSGYQKQRITTWRSSGVTVEVSTRDVTNKNDCFQLIQEVGKLGTIDAVFNLAVVLNDGLFEDQNEESFKVALNPKALATLHLDEVTRRLCPELRHFVVFSSVSCGRGNPGQTNYGMANSIMERICERRKSDGLPGLAIQWGAIGDVGLVAKLQRENKELVIGGTLQQKISSCLEALDVFLTQDHPVVSSMVVAEKSLKNTGSESVVDVIASMLGIKDLKIISFYSSLAKLGMDSMTGTETIQILERDFDIYITPKEIKNISLAKLVELEQEKKKIKPVSNEKKNGETNSPQGDDKNPLMIKLSNVDSAEAVKVFLLPGVDGILTSFSLLAENLKAHVLGIQYNYDFSKYSIQEYAQSILPHVEETVSKQGRFYIIGYSFGTLVASELTVLLENKGFEGSLVMIEGSPAYLLATHRQEFPQTDENTQRAAVVFKMWTAALPANLPLQQEDFYQCNSLDECFELVVSRLPDNIVEVTKQKKQDFFASYDLMQSITGYSFNHNKIKSCVHLFKAKTPLVSDFAHDYQLSELCEQPVQVFEVDGDHASILGNSQLVDYIRNIII